MMFLPSVTFIIPGTVGMVLVLCSSATCCRMGTVIRVSPVLGTVLYGGMYMSV